MFKSLKPSVYLTIAGLALMAISFQNCSRAHFSADSLEGATLKTEAISDDVGTRDPGEDGSGQIPQPTPAPQDPNSQPTPAPQDPNSQPTPAPTPVAGDNDDELPGNDPAKDPGKGKDIAKDPSQGDDEDSDGSDSEDKQEEGLVECQLLHPNMKVVLELDLQGQHRNSSSVRVCMSKNACLEVINAYAAQHSCSLEPGAASSNDDGQQCTEIFPGSKGTCHNARVLSDQQVSDLLKTLAEKK